MLGLQSTFVITFSVNFLTQTVEKLDKTRLRSKLPLNFLLQCSISENCLEVVARCDDQENVCVLLVPSLNIILVKQMNFLSKFVHKNFELRSVIKIQLLARQHRLLIIFNPSSSLSSVDLILINFQTDSMIRIFQTNIYLNKKLFFKTFAQVVLNDKFCINLHSLLYDAFVFWRQSAANACLIFVNRKVTCFALIEDHDLRNGRSYISKPEQIITGSILARPLSASHIGILLTILGITIFSFLCKLQNFDYSKRVPPRKKLSIKFKRTIPL